MDVKSLHDLSGEVAVVTGAGRGIGEGIARVLADAGAAVVLAARRTAEIERVAKSIVEGGGKALAVTTDVTDDASLEALAQAAIGEFGRLDIWVNNAGGSPIQSRLTKLPRDEWDATLRLNLTAVWSATVIADRHLADGGRILNISSKAAVGPIPGSGHYAAAKAGRELADRRPFAHELGPRHARQLHHARRRADGDHDEGAATRARRTCRSPREESAAAGRPTRHARGSRRGRPVPGVAGILVGDGRGDQRQRAGCEREPRRTAWWCSRAAPEGRTRRRRDFRLEEKALAPLADAQVRVRTVLHLSIDAFIRTTLEEEAYHGSIPVGGTVTAFGVGRVAESASEDFAPGDAVVGPLGAQSLASLPSGLLQRVDGERAPLTAYLGLLGLTSGVTAYMGVRHVGVPTSGETFVVSGAAGAVGSIAGQIAKLDGARVIGIAGGAEKGRWLTDELGFDAAIDYKGEDVATRLRELAPDGVNVYFDNVGGELLDVVLDQIVQGSRIVICGAISQYQGDISSGVRGPSLYLRLAERNARMEGFAVNHFEDRYGEAFAALATWQQRGEIRMREHVEHGLERFGATLRLLFTGGHTGKLLLAV